MQTTFFSRRPALRFVLLFCAGILLTHYYSFDTRVVFWIAFVLFLGSVVVAFASRNSRALDTLLMLLIVALGVALHSFQRQELAEKKIIPDEENEPIFVQGIVDDEPFVKGNHVQLVVNTERLVRPTQAQQVERRILVHGRSAVFNSSINELQVGALVKIRGVLEDYPRPRNPGAFDYGRYLELNDIHGVVTVKDSSQIEIIEQLGKGSFSAMVNRLQKSLSNIVERMHSEREASFLRGILLADRSKIAEEVKQAFVDTGTVHILAVSGLHVVVVATVFYGFFGLLRLHRKLVVFATILGLLGYMVLTGSTPSVVRATIMAIALFVGPLLERKTDVYQSLGFAAMVLLVWDTNNLFNVGFQLSFAAVFSIVYFYPIFVKVIHLIPERFEEIKMLDSVLKLFAVSLAAQLGTLPFTAYYFDRISVVSLVANLVVVPMSGVNVMLGFATLAFSVVSSWIAQCYAALNEWLVMFLLGFVKASASVPYAYVDASHFGASFLVLYYIGLIGLVNVDNQRVLKFTLVVGMIALNVLVYSSLVGGDLQSLTATFIDVGQGDAILLEFPNGKRVLLDAGPKSMNYDAGERIVAPFLKFKGIAKLDALIISHPHSDHIGGMLYALEHFQVARLIEPKLQGESALYREIHERAQQRSVPVLQYAVGDTIHVDENARLYVLHPYAPTDSTNNLNNASLVIKLVYGSNEILLTGDAEREVEEKLRRRFSLFLLSGILKAGHHGSNTSSTREFVESVHPEFAVVSVGKNNKFKHPSPEVISLFQNRGIQTHRTDKEGAVIAKSTGKEFEIVRWRDQ